MLSRGLLCKLGRLVIHSEIQYSKAPPSSLSPFNRPYTMISMGCPYKLRPAMFLQLKASLAPRCGDAYMSTCVAHPQERVVSIKLKELDICHWATSLGVGLCSWQTLSDRSCMARSERVDRPAGPLRTESGHPRICRQLSSTTRGTIPMKSVV